jgi:hypothetical protein
MTWSRALTYQSHGCARATLVASVRLLSDSFLKMVVQDASSGARARPAELIFNVVFMLVQEA